ncbi:unnamed protein product, partial [Ectocarpus sp. 12 AP-2014]
PPQGCRFCAGFLVPLLGDWVPAPSRCADFPSVPLPAAVRALPATGGAAADSPMASVEEVGRDCLALQLPSSPLIVLLFFSPSPPRPLPVAYISLPVLLPATEENLTAPEEPEALPERCSPPRWCAVTAVLAAGGAPKDWFAAKAMGTAAIENEG